MRNATMFHRARLCRFAAIVFCLFLTGPTAAAEPSRLTVTSHGAAGQVSGSLHLFDTGNGRWMVDCGKVFEKNQDESPQTWPPGVEKADAVFITHAHSDHLGRVPLLVDRGFQGPIYMTQATAELAVPMLRVLLRMDRSMVRRWTWSKERRLRAEASRKSLWLHWRPCKYCKQIETNDIEQATASFQELYDRFAGQTPRVRATICHECIQDEIAAIMRHVKPVDYDEPIEVAPGVRATFFDAGHIPGSASILFEVTVGGRTRRVMFSGDLGNGLSPLAEPPRPAPKADAVYVECTYGTIHRKESVRRQPAEFRRAVGEAIAQGGVVWIPCFSMDRTQKILHELHLAQREKLLPARVPIYCSSPSAKEVTKLYRLHRRDGWFPPAVASDAEAFSPRDVRGTVPSFNRLPRPSIIFSTSDPLLAQWMRRLLSKLLPEPTTTVLLVGYQASDTAGYRLLRGAKTLEIDGRPVAVRAKVRSFSCFSGHADAAQVDAWLANVPNESTIVLVHGGTEELATRAEELRNRGRRRVVIAKPGEPVELLQPMGG